jgi:hypothetical protein
MPEALLDHLVLATPDLEATVAAFADATGPEEVRAVLGGLGLRMEVEGGAPGLSAVCRGPRGVYRCH